MTAAAAPAREDDGPGVTTLELFFDLVFVFTMTAFFYAFVVMLLGLVVLAAGLALTIAAVDIRTPVETAALLGGGAAMYVAGDVLFRWKLGIEPMRFRAAAIPLLLATIPLGSSLSGMAQILAAIAVFVAVLFFEKRARAGAFTAPG